MQNISIGVCKQFAKERLRNRWLVPCLVTLICVIIPHIFYLIVDHSIPQIETLKSVLQSILDFSISDLYEEGAEVSAFWTSIKLTIGILFGALFIIPDKKMYLKFFYTCENHSLKDYFGDFRFFIKGLGVQLWSYLWHLLWYSVIIAPVAFLCGPLTSVKDNFKIFALGLQVFLILIAFIFAMYKHYQYCLIYYAYVDNGCKGIRKALKTSIQLTKGNVFSLFFLDISFIGWYILGILTLNFANVYYYPYYEMTWVNAYMALKGQTAQ